LESESSRFGTEFSFLAFVKTDLISGEMTGIEFLMGSHQMKNDAGQFVGRRRDGFGSAQFGSHAVAEIAEHGFSVVQ
jgi:hypothetical protein